MLAVSSKCRRRGIGSKLVSLAIERMVAMGCDEVMLETEVTNKDSLRLYGRLGFARDERLVRYTRRNKCTPCQMHQGQFCNEKNTHKHKKQTTQSTTLPLGSPSYASKSNIEK